MADISNLNQTKRKYLNLNGKIDAIISQLNNAIYRIEPGIANIQFSTRVDGESKLKESLNSSRSNAIALRNRLSGVVIPAIHTAIEGINREIARIEYEERMAAEEAARQEAEKQKSKSTPKTSSTKSKRK